VPVDLPEKVAAWLHDNPVYLPDPVGSDRGGDDNHPARKGDGDFVLLRTLALLYGFREAPDLLTPDAAWELLNLCEGVGDGDNPDCDEIPRTCDDTGAGCIRSNVPLLGNHLSHQRKLYRPFVYVQRFPETENHVLMINTWRFLANQYLLENAHDDARIADLALHHQRLEQETNNEHDDPWCVAGGQNPHLLDNEHCSLADALISMLRRVVMDDFFETNGRPYNAYSTLAIQLLASYADGSVPGSKSARVKQAAQNAMNFAATKFAFQSHFGKRSGHTRRSWDNSTSRGLYEGDNVIGMWGMLSGAYTYNDLWNCDDPDVTWEERPLPWFGCVYNDQYVRGFALDAALSSGLVAEWIAPRSAADPSAPDPVALEAIRTSRCRIPPVIHDFMLRPDNGQPGYGFWSRMQARYTGEHYLSGSAARYPVPFPGNDGFDWEAAMRDGRKSVIGAPEFYFGTARFMNAAGGAYTPYNQQAGSEGFRPYEYHSFSKPTVLIPNGNAFWENVPRYETLALLGANKDEPHKSTNIGVYKNVAYGYLGPGESHLSLPPTWRCALSFNIDGKPVCIVDHSDEGSFIIIVAMTPAEGLGARGLWEVVPAGLPGLDTVEAIRDALVEIDQREDMRLQSSFEVQYVSVVTGETLEFDNSEGKPLVAIDGDPARVEAVHRTTESRKMPLIHVAQVDEAFAFTGETYAWSIGDGRLRICNPALHAAFHLDSATETSLSS